ncbi:hypothetical protein BpHYR1_042717 [Brachionus plicatilis]|uniref:Secreted protein n=1 Tax=Brachionus plicatilis TaxID=10195 RepID=A0A3M7PUK9_BRAPC|nr:hypothetical protein BpHYR1_042717 [Brachionus plicatilis]
MGAFTCKMSIKLGLIWCCKSSLARQLFPQCACAADSVRYSSKNNSHAINRRVHKLVLELGITRVQHAHIVLGHPMPA